MEFKLINNGRNIEDEVNAWLKENPTVTIVTFKIYPMHDLFVGTGEVCNQWSEMAIFYTR